MTKYLIIMAAIMTGCGSYDCESDWGFPVEDSTVDKRVVCSSVEAVADRFAAWLPYSKRQVEIALADNLKVEFMEMPSEKKQCGEDALGCYYTHSGTAYVGLTYGDGCISHSALSHEMLHHVFQSIHSDTDYYHESPLWEGVYTEVNSLAGQEEGACK